MTINRSFLRRLNPLGGIQEEPEPRTSVIAPQRLTFAESWQERNRLFRERWQQEKNINQRSN